MSDHVVSVSSIIHVAGAVFHDILC